MRNKKGFSFMYFGIMILLLIFLLLALKIFGLDFFRLIIKAFGYLLSFISITLERAEDLKAGSLVAPLELNEAYNNLVSIFKNSYDKECILQHKDFPADFKGYYIEIEISHQPDKPGLFIFLKDPDNKLIKNDFIGKPNLKFPCVITGDSQVSNFLKVFELDSNAKTQQPRYAEANKISIKGKKNVEVDYRAGQPLKNGDIEDKGLMFNADKEYICFLLTYNDGFPTYGIGKSYNVGIPVSFIGKLSQKSNNYLCK